MNDGAALERLLRELRGTSSPVQRVKMLGRAWRTLRGLDRVQLHELARRAGLDHAEEYLERLARDKGRLTPSLLLQIMQRFRNIEPGEVDGLIRGLQDPDRRMELLHGGLEVVDDLLSESEAGEAAAIPVAPAVVEIQPEPPRTPPPEVAKADAEEPEAPEAPSVPEPEIVVTPAPMPSISRQRPEETAPPEPRRVAKPAPRPIPTAVPPPPSPPRREPRAEPPRMAEDGLLDRLSGASSDMRRLGILRRELAGIDPSDVERMRRLIETFTDGWVRRRALDAMLRAGLPTKLMHAVYLIEQLSSPTARRWCAGTLLDSRQLTAHERSALIERHHLFRPRERGHSAFSSST